MIVFGYIEREMRLFLYCFLDDEKQILCTMLFKIGAAMSCLSDVAVFLSSLDWFNSKCGAEKNIRGEKYV